MSEPIPRRRALSIMLGAVVAGCSTVVAGLSGLFISSTLKLGKTGKEVILGGLPVYGDKFYAVRMWVRADGGWYRRVEWQPVYIRDADMYRRLS